MDLVSLAQLLSRHGMSGVPVVDEKGVVVGIVTSSDLVRAWTTELDNVTHALLHFPSRRARNDAGLELLHAADQRITLAVLDLFTESEILVQERILQSDWPAIRERYSSVGMALIGELGWAGPSREDTRLEMELLLCGATVARENDALLRCVLARLDASGGVAPSLRGHFRCRPGTIALPVDQEVA